MTITKRSTCPRCKLERDPGEFIDQAYATELNLSAPICEDCAKYTCKSRKRVPGKLCGKEASERYSLGVYAGRFCDECWELSGYRNEGESGFDPSDAGEHYGESDY